MARIYSILAFKEIPHMPTKSEQIQAQLLNQPPANQVCFRVLTLRLGKLSTIYFLLTGIKLLTFKLARKWVGPITVKGQFLE